MKKERLRFLIDVSKQQTATSKQQRELNAWYASFEQDPGYTEQLSEAEQFALRSRMLSAFEQEHIRTGWWQRRRYWSIAAAATIAIAVALGSLFYLTNPADRLSTATEKSIDLLPGGNKATLTLADGRTIELNEAQTGIVVGNAVMYDDGSAVVTNHTDDPSADTPSLMSLSTPKGGTYQVTLPDGTKVWLNAGSTLQYPNRFIGNERLVRLEGEAYFDVAKADARSSKPFRITVGGQQVEVTGTQFNVSAYPDETIIKTTLIEGTVKLRANETDASVTLSPGEQGLFADGKLSKQPVNVLSAMAWKNGDFMFDNEPLESIMKRLGRWYDAEVVYQNAPKNIRLYGIVSRSKNISTVLEILEMTGQVKFKIEGPTAGHNERRIVVMQ
ncbi:DUF4974 domain-containing protein [Sphingobacterium sp. SGG-5]|uniref:FecR family protein n=1 Tax=Sphingobacterium sp. SGG-5 TaxID=2710881 RepID=UPI0013ED8CCA|nr:FecR family protein [Sphingobacterium sp. SGG-5]NGM61555.1 DUF4974 domain-containing protein [Sphingobacterium sp. SGG-5]